MPTNARNLRMIDRISIQICWERYPEQTVSSMPRADVMYFVPGEAFPTVYSKTESTVEKAIIWATNKAIEIEMREG